MHISQRGSVSKIYVEPIKIRKDKQSNRKIGSDFKQTVQTRGNQIANKHLKRYTASVVIG